MQFFRGCKDDTILWFIILFVLLFFCGNCGGLGNNSGYNDYGHNDCGCCD